MPIPGKTEIRAEVLRYRRATRGRPPETAIETAGPGEESVWDFPRPPEVQTVTAPLRVTFAGETVAETTAGLRVIETAGAPVYYFPPGDVRREALRPVPGHWSLCEWKGVAVYFDIVLAGRLSERAAFAYPDPLDDLGCGFPRIKDHLAFYASRVDAAFIGNVRVTPQPGGFYAGWVTPSLRGPIKGVPGSEGW